MPDARFIDPDLQAIYTCLDLAAVRRRTARTPRPRRSGRSRSRDDRRTLESQARTVLRRRAGHLRGEQLRGRARAWAGMGLWPAEMEAWIDAVGVDGAVVASACLQAGIALSVMDVVLDGVRVRQRLRGGESAAAVLARAAACGRSPSS
ncbi:hypothetical protein [Streptomyces chartreusis]|uniref:hypothetical protein n=1 Tax=Streptomyces chartreusis TaxID=1969 RepID=UPI0035DAE9B1